jgi:hypothetical protein
MNSGQIEHIKKIIQPLRRQIIEHPVYAKIHSMEHIYTFMEHHVYAVWDFMSLLKSLQNQLTCTTVPWLPVGDANIRCLINEIVIGEESDLDYESRRSSHFEMYLDAMERAGANTASIRQFIKHLQATGDVGTAIRLTEVPRGVIEFLNFTFQIIQSNKLHQIAAVFTFGREDLIPDMFLSIIDQLHREFPERISAFKYYIERHIQVDGEHHSHLALEMVAGLCGTNQIKWEEALEAATKALEMRKLLWDAILKQISTSREVEI